MKSFDTEAAAKELPPLLHDETAVLSLQNGLNNEETLAAMVGAEHIMGGAAYIFSTIKEPGLIKHTGGPTSFTFGELDGSRSERAKRILDWCDRADEMEAELSESIQVVLWEKATFICDQAGMTAAVRLSLEAIRETEESWTMY